MCEGPAWTEFVAEGACMCAYVKELARYHSRGAKSEVCSRSTVETCVQNVPGVLFHSHCGVNKFEVKFLEST